MSSVAAKMRPCRPKFILIAAAAFFIFLASFAARATIFTVSNAQDGIGAGTLRGALIAASLQEGEHMIFLKEGIYELSFPPATNDPPGFSGALTVTRGRITIIGAGTNVIVTTAPEFKDRIFKVGRDARLRLERLTITGGISPRGTNMVNEDGAGIHNNGSLELDHCTIVSNFCEPGNWIPTADRFGGKGGGIYNSGFLAISDCDIEGNASGSNDLGDGGDGGGVYNDMSGTLFLRRSKVSHNQSGSASRSFGFVVSGWPPPPPHLGGKGGGIFNLGNVSVSNSILASNTAGADEVDAIGFGGDGGGLFNSGSAVINGSAIYANSGGFGPQGGLGGGLCNLGRMTLESSTISGNTAGQGGTQQNAFFIYGGRGGNGGGIFNNGRLRTKSCTIANNQAGGGGNGVSWSAIYPDYSPGGAGGGGGGIYNDPSNSSVRLRNTLIAQNLVGIGGPGGTNRSGIVATTGSPGDCPDVSGVFLSDGFNLIGINDAAVSFAKGTNFDLFGSGPAPIDPMIGPLDMNGGLTPTHALLPGSPAIDQGNSSGLAYDQRGFHRPFDNRSIANPHRGDGNDIGAYEVHGR